MFRKYQSHKIVEAARITDVTGCTLTLDTPAGAETHEVDPTLFARYTPVTGDYLVRYADGYLSISPKAAFEEGYTEIDDRTSWPGDMPEGAA